jgi:uncharacterized protein (DUF2249 family)
MTVITRHRLIREDVLIRHPGQLRPVTRGEPAQQEVPFMSGHQITEETRLDVREISPRERHPLIFQTFDDLKPGSAFVLVNDHDPKPLRYQLAAEREGTFEWDYLESGPETWQVRITKTKAS